MRISKLFATSTMLFSSALYAAEPHVYVVKQGDTLSTIAQRQVGTPIFKKNGSLTKLLSWNPNITDADLIFVGQQLSIGAIGSQKISGTTKNHHPR
jgi:LysM repeat protein